MTQEVVITKKKSKEQLWKEILEKAREALEKNAEIKKKLIQKTAEVLEEKGMPLYQICGAMTRELKEYASGQYIRECLDDKYKNPVMKREQKHEEIAQVSSANDDNNVLSNPVNDLETEQQITEEERQEPFHIRPEDYNINDLDKYSNEFKDRIIIHLDERLKQLEGVKHDE